MNKQILQKSDIAELTGRHVKTIERWIREGFFPGGRYMKGRQVWTEKEFSDWFSKLPERLQSKNSVGPRLHDGASQL